MRFLPPNVNEGLSRYHLSSKFHRAIFTETFQEFTCILDINSLSKNRANYAIIYYKCVALPHLHSGYII